jgi:hypothetical protein
MVSVEVPPRMFTLGHSKSGAVPAAVVPVAAVVADAKKDEKFDAGVLSTDDEQPGRMPPSTTAAATGKQRRPVPTRRIRTPPRLND